MLEFLKKVYIMNELKTGLYSEKFATFWVIQKRLYHSFVLQMTLQSAKFK